MQIVAIQKSIRVSPRKVGVVISALKGLSLEASIVQLGHLERRPSLPVLKVVRQAVANAQHNHGLTIDQLKLHSITVTSGTFYKRFRAVSRGRGHGIIKKTSHIKVILTTGDETVMNKKNHVDAIKNSTNQKINSTKEKKATVTGSTQEVVKPDKSQVASKFGGKSVDVNSTKQHQTSVTAISRRGHQRKGSR